MMQFVPIKLYEVCVWGVLYLVSLLNYSYRNTQIKQPQQSKLKCYAWLALLTEHCLATESSLLQEIPYKKVSLELKSSESICSVDHYDRPFFLSFSFSPSLKKNPKNKKQAQREKTFFL